MAIPVAWFHTYVINYRGTPIVWTIDVNKGGDDKRRFYE